MKFAAFLVASVAAYTESYSVPKEYLKGQAQREDGSVFVGYEPSHYEHRMVEVEPGYSVTTYDEVKYAKPATMTGPYQEDYLTIPNKPMKTWEYRAEPTAEHRHVTGYDRTFADRSRLYHLDFNEYDKEDWDTDLWAQQVLSYDLDDERDSIEQDMSLVQDGERAEFDDWWETYRKATTDEELEYGYSNQRHGHSEYGYEEDYGYGLYTKVDVRETLLRTNELWNADVTTVRQTQRDTLAAERQAHRDTVAAIVADYDTEVAEIKAAMLAARAAKRADVETMYGNLRTEVATLIATSHAEVADENKAHQALVLELLEAVDYHGAHADVRGLLEMAGEGDIDIFGGDDLRAFHLKKQGDVYRNDMPPSSYWPQVSSHTWY